MSLFFQICAYEQKKKENSWIWIWIWICLGEWNISWNKVWTFLKKKKKKKQ